VSTQARCRCQSCTVRSLIGPAVVITLGFLFLLSEMHGGRLHFDNTWPVLLVVIGAVMLASALAPRDGHIQAPPQSVPPAVPPPPAPPAGTPTTPYSSQGQ